MQTIISFEKLQELEKTNDHSIKLLSKLINEIHFATSTNWNHRIDAYNACIACNGNIDESIRWIGKKKKELKIQCTDSIHEFLNKQVGTVTTTTTLSYFNNPIHYERKTSKSINDPDKIQHFATSNFPYCFFTEPKVLLPIDCLDVESSILIRKYEPVIVKPIL